MNTFHKKVHSHLKIIYQNILIDEEINILSNQIFEKIPKLKNDDNLENWNESDIFLISYGDSIVSEKNKKLKFVRIPKFEEVPYPVVMEPNLVIEYYSR